MWITARTFNFIKRAPGPAPSFSDNRAEIDQLVQQAITSNIQGKGVRRVDTVHPADTVGVEGAGISDDQEAYGGDRLGMRLL